MKMSPAFAMFFAYGGGTYQTLTEGGDSEHMPISLVGTSALPIGATLSSHSITLPTGIASGDLILILTGTQDSSSAGPITTPSGFTRRWHGGHSGSFIPYLTAVYKVAAGTESGASVTITWPSGSYDVCAVAAVFRGVDTSTPFDATEPSFSGGGSNPNPGAITTVTNGAWVLAVANGNRPGGISTPTPPSGFTSVIHQATGGADRGFALARKEKATAGSDDPAAFGWSPIDNSTAITLALRPAPTTPTWAAGFFNGSTTRPSSMAFHDGSALQDVDIDVN